MPTPKELNSFDQLQKLLASPRILIHFDDNRWLYIDLDASKEFGLAAHVYYCADDDPTKLGKHTNKIFGQAVQTSSFDSETSAEYPRQKSQQPILFLSRMLTDAEARYWPTKMEVAALVWAIKKVRHMVEATRKPVTIVYTDHSATVAIVKQISLNTVSTEKLNLRLIRASEYLQRFRLDVRYKPGKVNIIPDALSHLASQECRPGQTSRAELDELDALTVKCYPVSLVEMNPGFRQRIIKEYEAEPRWSRILKQVQDNKNLEKNAVELPYQILDNVLYFKNDERGLRLCISIAIEGEVFKLAHDKMGHLGYTRTLERLTQGLFIYNLSTKLHEFIRHCPHCQTNQTPRPSPYGVLQPILAPARPFDTLTIDFVLALLISTEPELFDYALMVTDKLSKAITPIPGRATWGLKEWAVVFLGQLAMVN